MDHEAWKEVLKATLAAGGLGVGARTLMGLPTLLGQKRAPRPKPPLVVDVPYKLKNPDDEDKAAGIEDPVFMPSMTAGVGGGLLGGWALANRLLHAKHKRDLEEEAEEERERLEQAELAKFKPTEAQKIAQNCTQILAGKEPPDEAWKHVSEALEKMASLYQEKQANFPGQDALGTTLGGYLTAAMLGGVGTGALTYNYFRNTDPQRIKAKAIKDQLESLESSGEPNLLAHLIPVDERGKRTAPPKEKGVVVPR